MFHTERWAFLSEKSYGYRSSIIDDMNSPIYCSWVSNEIGKYVVTPAFGDFINLTENDFASIEAFVAKYPEWEMNFKVCSSDELSVDSLVRKNSGYVHQINYESYEVWRDYLIRAKFRNQINQSRRSGLNIRVSSDQDDIIEFWMMHAHLRLHKFGEIPQPKQFFLNLFHLYIKEDRGFLIGAYDNSRKLLAGIIVLIEGDTAYYKYAASALKTLSLRPNNFVMDRLIEHLEKQGLNKLNLGYTGDSESYKGLRKYKTSAGATEERRYTLSTRGFALLRSEHNEQLKQRVSELLDRTTDLEVVDRFSARYYRLFV